jgi:hypothetical protein
VHHDIDPELVEQAFDQVAEAQLVGQRGGAGRDLEPEVEVTALEVVEGPRAEHAPARLGAEHLLRRASDRLDLAWLEPHDAIRGTRRRRGKIDRRRPRRAPS